MGRQLRSSAGSFGPTNSRSVDKGNTNAKINHEQLLEIRVDPINPARRKGNKHPLTLVLIARANYNKNHIFSLPAQVDICCGDFGVVFLASSEVSLPYETNRCSVMVTGALRKPQVLFIGHLSAPLFVFR